MSHNKIQVRYAVRYDTLGVTHAEYDLVYTLYHLSEPQKVNAIKFIRQQYNISLKEAKDVCDAIAETERVRHDY